MRDVLTRAHERLVSRGQETVLFIDEVHRFSKSQQDALLPAVENRDVTFIGATTENPSFSVIKPLLSRSVVVKLESLEPNQLTELVQRALADERGLKGEVKALTKRGGHRAHGRRRRAEVPDDSGSGGRCGHR